MKLKTSVLDLLKEEFTARPATSDREEAWSRFSSLGLPTRKSEAFQYIPLQTIYESVEPSDRKEEVTIEEVLPRILPGSERSFLVFVDGMLRPDLSDISALPKQVEVKLLSEAWKGSYGAFLRHRHHMLLEDEEDPFPFLNAALYSEGSFVYVPPQVVVDAPLQILSMESKGVAYVGPRVHLALGMGAKLDVVQTETGKEKNALHNIFLDVALEEEAVCNHTCHMPKDFASFGFMTLRASVKRKGFFSSFLSTFGSGSLRHDYKVFLQGEEAEADLRGICLAGEKNHAHVHVHMDHKAPNCRSNQLFKNVLKGFGRASFTGKIYVHQIAQKTEAYQLNNNLLLSDDAVVCSKPNLEIFADDVKASHGSTVAQINEEQLLYLRTRGVKEAEASALLTKGFCEELIDQISSAKLRETVLAEVSHFLSY